MSGLFYYSQEEQEEDEDMEMDEGSEDEDMDEDEDVPAPPPLPPSEDTIDPELKVVTDYTPQIGRYWFRLLPCSFEMLVVQRRLEVR